MSYVVGDHVKVKVYENPASEPPYFTPLMAKFCGTVITLKYKYPDMRIWSVVENSRYWHEEWFDPVEKDMFTDKDFEI